MGKMNAQWWTVAACTIALMAFAADANAQCNTGNCGPIRVDGPPIADVGTSSIWDDCGVESTYAEATGTGMGGCGNWFFAVNGLIFARDDDDATFLSYQDSDGEPLLNTRHAQMDYSGGFEVRFGRYFNCGRNAVEAVYWGIYPDKQSAAIWGADAVGALQTTQVFDSLVIDPAGANLPITSYFAGAEMHQIRRGYEAHNIELNLLGLAGFGGKSAWGGGGCGGGYGSAAYAGDACGDGSCGTCSDCGPTCGTACGGGCGGGAVFTWLLGPRFLRFREDMLYATDLVDTTFTGTADELAYLIDVENNLLGFQFGGRADLCLGKRFSL